VQELVWLLEPIKVWLHGGSLEEGMRTHGFLQLAGILAFAVPGTVIALGIGMTDWHETPLGAWLGARGPDPDDCWKDRACDLDKDGIPDI
jgi:hypothetical protein